MICKNQSCKVRQISPKFLPIQTSRLTSVGCALDPGSHMVALGTTATGKREHWKTFPTKDIYVTHRYDEDEAKSNRDNQEASRSALQRYLFYCNR